MPSERVETEELSERCTRCAGELVRKGEEPFLRGHREALRTGISGLLLGAGLLLTFGGLDVELGAVFGRSVSVATLLYLGAVAFGAFHFVRQGLQALRTFSLGINVLMGIAVVGAVAIGEHVEAASLAFLFALAELLEEYAVARARRSLRALLELAPPEARVQRADGRAELVPVEQIAVGEVLEVRPGERIALDGVVVAGASAVNQAPITGESVPVEKGPGDPVYAGTINQDGYLEVRVTKQAGDTTLARIVRLIGEAEAKKAPSERFVDHFARYYTPAVVAVAVGVAAVPPLAFGASFTDWFVRALTLLVIACPCALLISTPVSIVSALTSAARNGVLIKGGVYLEELGQVRAIAIDKTGTLTTGQLAVTDVVPLNGHSATEVLRVAAALERKSQHPIAQAIVEHYHRAIGEPLPEATDFEALAGRGVRARLCLEGAAKPQPYLVGRLELFGGEAELPELPEAKTVVGVGTPERLMGFILVADRVRPEAGRVIRELEQLGLEVILITGDNEGTAQAVARRLGIAHYHAGVLPEGKVAEIAKLVAQHGKVAMVGDGVNDAPALAAATVGIAMGAIGTDAALEAADVALMADDLTQLPYLIRLSRGARRVIRQNVWFSILTKFTLGAGVLPGYVSLVLAVLVGDMGASLAVTGNAMRLARAR